MLEFNNTSPDCVGFARSLINNVSLVKNIVLAPTHDDITRICLILQQLSLNYTDQDMHTLLYQDCPRELLVIFKSMQIIS